MHEWFKTTLMVQIGVLKAKDVAEISKLLGTEYSIGLLAERTKQDKSKKDSTYKVKQFILFREHNDCFICDMIVVVVLNPTLVINTAEYVIGINNFQYALSYTMLSVSKKLNQPRNPLIG